MQHILALKFPPLLALATVGACRIFFDVEVWKCTVAALDKARPEVCEKVWHPSEFVLLMVPRMLGIVSAEKPQGSL